MSPLFGRNEAPSSGERSPEDREWARAVREARRKGLPEPPRPKPKPAPPPDFRPEQAWDERHVDDTGDLTPAPVLPEDAPDPPAAAPAADDPIAHVPAFPSRPLGAPEPEREPEIAWEEPTRAAPAPAVSPPPPPRPESAVPAPPPAPERPSAPTPTPGPAPRAAGTPPTREPTGVPTDRGPRRIPRLGRERRGATGDLPRTPPPLPAQQGGGHPPRVPPRDKRFQRRPAKKSPIVSERSPRRAAGRLGALVALLAVAGALWLAFSLFQPFAGEGGDRVRVTVPSGASAREVGDLLAERGVVDSGRFFALRARLSGQRDDLRAGRFALRSDMSYAAALEALTAIPPEPRTVAITVPEGRSRQEEAAVLRRAGIRGDYLAATARPPRGFDPRDYGAPRGTRSLEGFLFPATYELREGRVTARTIVRAQLAEFREQIRRVSMRRARARNLSRYDVLIIASMIEREVSVARERRLVSAVIHNRLREGIPLGIDATIRYATRNWTRPIRQSELDRDGPYNTRLRQGLPPTPIGSPGLASIRAAANPANVDYLYYVVKPGGRGEHAFSSTKGEFDRDVARYNQARAAAGGRDPSDG